MEKVMVTNEQAEAIERLANKYGKDNFLERHTTDDIWLEKRNHTLNDISVVDMAKVLYIGYEVEPEFKVEDWVVLEYEGRVHVIGEITEIETEKFTVARVDDPKYPVPQRVLTSKLRRATESEIAQEKERRWWSKHGREVWELKVGDLRVR